MRGVPAQLIAIAPIPRPPMQHAPPAKDVLLNVQDVDAPTNEHDLDLKLADEDIAMHPVTGSFTMHPKHESACSAQIFRLAFPSHVLLMAGQCVVQGELASAGPRGTTVFWALATAFSAFSLIARVLLHQMHDIKLAQQIGAWCWTILMLQDCALGIVGYLASPYADVCIHMDRGDYFNGAVASMLSALAFALANGTHGMSFGHKSVLAGLMLASDLVLYVACGEAELVLMISEMASLAIGYVVAHMAELFVRHSYADKVMEMRRTDKEKRCLEERNEQLKAEKERLLYDVQLPGRHLAADERSAIARGLHAKTGQLNTSSWPTNSSEVGWSEPGAPSDSAPPSFPPGPPSSSAPTEPSSSSAQHRAVVPLDRAGSHTEADRQHGIAARLVTDQKLAPPLVEIGHQWSASSAKMAARATKRKPAHLGKSRAENLARRMTIKAGVKQKRYLLKVPPLTWEEADRQHYERISSKLDAERMVYAILDNHCGRVGNASAPPCAEALAAPSTPQIKAETISAQAQAAAETISTQVQAAAAALAAMANGGARGQGATALV